MDYKALQQKLAAQFRSSLVEHHQPKVEQKSADGYELEAMEQCLVCALEEDNFGQQGTPARRMSKIDYRGRY